MPKIAVKEVDEVVNSFLENLESAEKKVNEIIEKVNEEAGRLVSEAAAESKNLERLYENVIDEIKDIVNKRTEEAVKKLREEKEKEIEALLKNAESTFNSNFEKAVDVILKTLFG